MKFVDATITDNITWQILFAITFMLDALPDTTLSVYPNLGPALQCTSLCIPVAVQPIEQVSVFN